MVKGLRRRPPTPAEDDTVQVQCVVCKYDLLVTRDALRDMVDTGRSPECGRGPRLCVPATTEEVEARRQQTKLKVTTSTKALNKGDKILVALAVITTGTTTARKEDVVVQAWLSDKQAFGLRGYDHPSDNRVIMELVKLVRQNLVENPKPCEYRPTPFGRKYAEKLTGGQ